MKARSRYLFLAIVLPLLVGLVGLMLLGLRFLIQRQEAARYGFLPPVVRITEPQSGSSASVGSYLSTFASITFSPHSPAKTVEWYLDGVLLEIHHLEPGAGVSRAYDSYDLLLLDEGTHMLVARATDELGVTALSPPLAFQSVAGNGSFYAVTAGEGETLHTLAVEYGSDAAALAALNPGVDQAPAPGTIVKVPIPPEDEPPVSLPAPPAPGNTITLIATHPMLGVAETSSQLASLLTVTPPQAPTNLQGEVRECQVKLAWEDNAKDETGYEVWMAAAEEAPASPSAVTELDKWSLWNNGTQLRGANLWQRIVVPEVDGPEFLGDGYVGPPVEQSDLDALAALGANVIDLSHPGLFTERPPYVLDEQVQANLDRLVEMAGQADLFVVITFRTGPGRSDFTFYRDGAGEWFDPDLLIETVWTDPAAQDAWVDMWRYTADRYRETPNVAGYDLMCEPNGEGVLLDMYDPELFFPEHTGSLLDWNQFYPRLVDGIREVDSEKPILVSAQGWGSVCWLPALVPTGVSRTVYMVHQYEPQGDYSHQGAGGQNTYPGEFDLDWDGEPDPFHRDWLAEYLSTIEAFRREHGVPVSVNEFGVERWVPGAAEFMADQMDLFEDLGMNHMLWAWDPAWEPWTSSSNGMNYLFGPDPDNHTSVDNALLEVITGFWSRNTLRPSNFAAD